MRISRKKILFFCALAIVVFGLWHAYFGNPFFHTKVYSVSSPDGRYELDLYTKPKPMMSMPGDGGTVFYHAILRNRYGLEIGATTEECATMEAYPKEKVDWSKDNKYVWFGLARGFNLETGKCEY